MSNDSTTTPTPPPPRVKPVGITLTSQDAPQKYQFDEHYLLQDKISKGSFGVVYVTQHRSSGHEFAVKVIERQRLSHKDNDGVMREVSILKDCTDVDNIVRLVDFYMSPTQFHVVQVYAQGGDVFERLAQRASYNEREARDLCRHLLRAMQELHARKLAHRDLKPENLLLRNLLNDSEILVADFGFAKYVPTEGLKTRCGTPAFVAPEVLVPDARYDERVDMWSVGCLMYMLLGGYPPFQDRNHRGLFRKIRGADFCFHDAYWKNVSISAKQLISSLLTTDPKYRCGATLALEKSSWLKIKDRRLEENDLSASLSEIKKFQARQSLKSAIHAVRWSIANKFKSVSDMEFSNQIKQWDKDDEAKERVENALLTRIRPTLRFADVYELKHKLHTSQSATIWDCVHKKRQEVYAVKILERKKDPRKSVTGKSLDDAIMHELAVLKALKHQNVIEIIDFFEEDNYFYLLMEKMEGGDVFDRIMSKQKYTEKDARDLAKILLEAVKHMHGEAICHRDLKPQNLLLKSAADDADIKVADFGFACRVHTPQSLTTRCGTPTYVAPEILKNIPYDQSADMWSVGVILYVLLCGYPPFADQNQSALFQKIRTGEWEFNKDDWHDISAEAKELISNLLVVDPARRWTARDSLNSAWLSADDKRLSSKNLHSADLIKRRRSRFKTVAKTVMWMNKGSARKCNGDDDEGEHEDVSDDLELPMVESVDEEDGDEVSRQLEQRDMLLSREETEANAEVT